MQRRMLEIMARAKTIAELEATLKEVAGIFRDTVNGLPGSGSPTDGDQPPDQPAHLCPQVHRRRSGTSIPGSRDRNCARHEDSGRGDRWPAVPGGTGVMCDIV